MALALALEINGRAPGFTFVAAGTDGQDGPTPVAGVVVDCGQKFSDEELQLGREHLANHDSYNFWRRLRPSWLVDTGGPTGVNVMDVYCLIRD